MSVFKDFLGERLKLRFAIDGIMPERALLRLKRADIAVYNVKKPQKSRILLSIKKKDREKFFAIFPDPCYNNNGYVGYTVTRLGFTGAGKWYGRLKNRVGFLLGALLFCAVTLYVDGFVFGVRFTGSDTYARETLAALEENGIKPFTRYQSGKEDLICARILSQKNVEFCSVQKRGLYVVVEVRTSPFPERVVVKGDMKAARSGVLQTLTVLRGTALKSTGESVKVGEPIVGAYLLTQDLERKSVAAIARASIACAYEKEIAAESEEQAFATAYLELGLISGDEIKSREITQTENGYLVKIEYVFIQTLNF